MNLAYFKKNATLAKLPGFPDDLKIGSRKKKRTKTTNLLNSEK